MYDPQPQRCAEGHTHFSDYLAHVCKPPFTQEHALTKNFSAMVLIIIEESFFLAGVTVTQYYIIDLFLYDLFLMFSECMLIFVFYNIIHKLLDHLTDSGRPYAAVVIIHWLALAFAVALALASWALYVGYQVALVQRSSVYNLGAIYNKLASAQAIYFWVISVEILAWSIFATVKAGSHRFVSRVSSH